MVSRLLLFDQDPALLARITGWLERENWNILSVLDPHEAVERLRSVPFDVVIAGQGSNGFDGLKLLRRLHSIRPDTRVILTGDRDPERAIAALRAHAYSYLHHPPAPSPLIEIVQSATDSADWRDDLRVISARPEWVTLEIRGRTEAAERTTHLVRELAVELPPAVCEDVAAAFRELLFNAVEHGCRLDPRKHIRVSLLRTPSQFMVHIQDPGKGFSLSALPHAAVSNPELDPTHHVEVRAEKGQRPGGFGILMASRLVDELLYNERGNEVFFVKNVT
jgi:DNA-binding NarL/FixJ family response regulator